jgi:hypothetical protein
MLETFYAIDGDLIPLSVQPCCRPPPMPIRAKNDGSLGIRAVNKAPQFPIAIKNRLMGKTESVMPAGGDNDDFRVNSLQKKH